MVQLPNKTHKSSCLIMVESLRVCFYAAKHSPHVVSVPQRSQLQSRNHSLVSLLRVTLQTGTRYVAWLPFLVSLVWCVPGLILSFPFQWALWHLQPPCLRVSHKSCKILSALSCRTDRPSSPVSADCREEMYPCTRMYSVHRPIKQCVGAMCFYRWCGATAK